MNLYLISQDQNDDYDTYDSAVVAAATEEDARNTFPGPFPPECWLDSDSESWCYDCWTEPKNVTVKLIGTAADELEAGVVCASFNAG